MKPSEAAPRAEPRRDAGLDPEQWVEEHHGRIYAYLRRRSASDADAAELTQQTFARAWSALDRFEGRSTVATWLHGIAHHVWLDWRRKTGRYEERSDAWWEQVPCEGVAPDQTTEHRDASRTVYAAVERLDEDLRDTVHLHYYQGLSLAETAEVLGVAVSTVKYRLRTALERLQRAVALPALRSSSSDLNS